MTTTTELNWRGLRYAVLVSQDITPADRADLDRHGLPYKVSVASNITPAALAEVHRRGLRPFVSVAAGITPAGKTALDQRGLHYAVLVPATSAVALLASLEHEGLNYLVEVDSSGNSVDGAATAPVNTGLPAITGTPTVGQTLTASTGTWTGSPTPTYTYQWKNAGVAIGGATASTYGLVAGDEGDLITVTETATNSAGSASATSASVGPIAAASTGPVLSAMSAVDFADVFAWGQATTDVATGVLYGVAVPQADATPTAIQITESKNAAGTVITQSGNMAVSAIGARQALVYNLTAVTAYKLCFAQLAGGLYSNVVTANFTTDTLVVAVANAGVATGMTAGVGTAAFGTNQADPIGGTGAVRWIDTNDAASGNVTFTCAAIFFNGVNKVHLTAKNIVGAPWIRAAPGNITAGPGGAHWNTATGAIGTNGAGWTPAPTTFSLGSGWYMWSGQANLAGADVTGNMGFWKGPIDNTIAVTRNGTTSDLYNIRITRV